MKIKTSELTGPALDWAVAKCEGRTVVSADKIGVWCDAVKDLGRFVNGNGTYKVDCSTDWSQGGPIIEREGIDLIRYRSYGDWGASIAGDGGVGKHAPTPLIAAMRCYVASKLGDEIDIPEELCSS